MNISKIDKLITEYLDEIFDKPCSACLCYEYCKKANEEDKDRDWDCHGMIEGWLNS